MATPYLPLSPWVGFFALALGACDGGAPAAGLASSTAHADATVVATSSPAAVLPSSTGEARAAAPQKRTTPCGKGPTVSFDDATLESVARRQLQRPEGAILMSELGRIKTLDLSQARVNDELDPCIFPLFTGVKGLYLAPGKLDDITVLKSLKSLESLRISVTHVKDISALGFLLKLDRVDLGRTPVSDLTPLANCKDLTELQLDETEVTDLAPLSKLVKLEMLSIKRTRISDVSPLRGLTKLKNLYVEGSLVTDWGTLGAARQLKVHAGY
ncbi:MAG: leucine-rich repeat domain-containing protein [Myxococcales bacterium]|nr:leucine-rich repeat domain-containing protein [Myxococcales bacterium]